MTTTNRQRLDAQLLSRPTATTPEQVVGHLLAVQAQDPQGMRLAIRARSSGVSAADVDRALDDGRLVVSWLNRGTLHLVRAEDFWELFALTTPRQHAGGERRLRQLGVSPEQVDRAVDVLLDAVGAGPRTRGELRDELDAAGLPTAGQALVHLLAAASRRGLLVRGPMRGTPTRGTEQAFVAAEQWLGPRPDVDADIDPADALRRLARRYLRGHAPAEPGDLATWAGVPLGAARRAMHGLEAVPASALPAPLPPPRLLGAFDPLLLGWADREPFLGPHGPRVVSGGIFRPFALVDGRAVATWGLRGGRVELDYLESVPADVARALAAEAEDVRSFLGLSPGAA